MLGVGWTEMLVIGVVALIVIGPRELPALMQRMGKVVGTIRRMGQDFQREINRSSGLEQMTDLRKSITEPLKKTTAEIRKEFNAIGSNGTVKPSGAIKPTDPKVESVVDSIKQQAGITAPAEPAKTGAAATTSATPSTSEPVKAAVLPKVPPQPTAPVATADLPTVEASAPAQPSPLRAGTGGGDGAGTPEAPAKPKTPRKRTARPKPVDSPAPIEAIAPSKATPPRRPRKKAAPAAIPEVPSGTDDAKPADEA